MKNKIKKIYLFEQLPIKYSYYDCNPNVDSDEKIYACNDCSVRALSKLTGDSWDNIYNKLFKTAKKLKAMPDSVRVIERVAKSYGYTEIDRTFSSTVAAFILTHPKGEYMIYTEGHLFACIDSTIYDSCDGKPLKKSEIEYTILQYIISVYCKEKK